MTMYSSEADVEITSVDVAAQDEIIGSSKIGPNPSNRYNIQVTESNSNAVKIQPWASLDNVKWSKIKYSDAQDHWDVGADATDMVYCDNDLQFRYFKLTGYVAAGTSKVTAHVLVSP